MIDCIPALEADQAEIGIHEPLTIELQGPNQKLSLRTVRYLGNDFFAAQRVDSRGGDLACSDNQFLLRFDERRMVLDRPVNSFCLDGRNAQHRF